MANEEHLAILRRGAEPWHACGSEQLPRPAGRAVVEDALEAVVSRLRKRLANAAAGVRVETKRGIGSASSSEGTREAGP
jgi:hypothetical protein